MLIMRFMSVVALMFSATFRKRVERVARDILTDPLRVVQGDAGEVCSNLISVCPVATVGGPGRRW